MESEHGVTVSHLTLCVCLSVSVLVSVCMHLSVCACMRMHASASVCVCVPVYVKRDTKKKSHTRPELNIKKGYLFRGKLTDHSPLLERGIQQPEDRENTCFASAFIV